MLLVKDVGKREKWKSRRRIRMCIRIENVREREKCVNWGDFGNGIL